MKASPSPEKADIAVLGPQYTNSDLAAAAYEHLQKKSYKKFYAPTLTSVFDAVESGSVPLGVVPLENMLEGSVRETLEQLSCRNVSIVEKFNLKIKYALVTLPGVEKKDIDTIASHQQALQQCSKYLQTNFPKALRENHTSTIAAYKKIYDTHDRHSAAIIPQEVVKYFDVNVLAQNIQNNSENQTTFIVIQQGVFTKKY